MWLLAVHTLSSRRSLPAPYYGMHAIAVIIVAVCNVVYFDFNTQWADVAGIIVVYYNVLLIYMCPVPGIGTVHGGV